MSAAASAALAAFAAPRPPCLAWRRATQHHRLRPARRPPLRRLRRPSRRRAAPCSPRLAWRRWHHHLPSRAGCRYGGLGGFRAAALRRAVLAPLAAALLSTLAFASRVGCHYGGLGGFRAAALLHACLRLAHRLPLWRPSRLSRRRAAPRSPRLAWRRAAQHHLLRLSRRLPPRQLRRLLRRRAAPRSPRFAGATLPSTTASAPRLGLRFGNFGGFLAAALRRTRLASLGAAQLSTLAFVSRVGCRYGGCVCAAPRCAALASRRAHLASFGSVLRSTRLPATALHRARPGGFGASRAAALRRVNCRFGGGAGFTPKRCVTRSPRLRCGTNKGPRPSSGPIRHASPLEAPPSRLAPNPLSS